MTTTVDISLVMAAGLFIVLAGVNDGGTLLATSLKMTSLRPLTAAVLLTVAVAVAPAIFGTEVATTLAERLVSFRAGGSPASPDSLGDQGALLIALVSAIAVVIVLSRRGLPTSLTIALLGGIVGVGLGGDLSITWPWVQLVLLLAIAAPFAGLLGAFVVARSWGAMPWRVTVARQVRQAHRLGFTLQAFAYGTNGGQIMLALLALATAAGAADGQNAAQPWMHLTLGALFALGLLLGVRRYGARLGSGVLPISPKGAVTAQFSSALAVLGSAAVGAPVSTTQALTGALVGSGLAEATGRIRWQHAAGIVAAWLLTLPVAGLVAALPAAIWIRT